MRIADLTTGPAKMMASYKTLRLKWEDTKEHWHDTTRRKFEQNYLDPLEPKIAAAMEAITRLAEVLSRAERDCE